MAPCRPRKNDEAVESLIRNPSSKTDFRSIGNQQVITNLMFPHWELLESRKQSVSIPVADGEKVVSLKHPHTPPKTLGSPLFTRV